jgi:hypothetical protein
MGNPLEEDIAIPKGHLLWRARGLRWDHAFLMLPQLCPKIGWYNAYKAIAASPFFEAGRHGISQRIFSIEGDDGRDLRLSVAHIEDQRLDSAGRTIHHTFFYLLPQADGERQAVPVSWPDSVWASLREAFETLYTRDAEPELIAMELQSSTVVPGNPLAVMNVVKVEEAYQATKQGSKNFRSRPDKLVSLILVSLLAVGLALASVWIACSFKLSRPEAASLHPMIGKISRGGPALSESTSGQ